MVEKRAFRIVVVDGEHGIGSEVEKNANKEVSYEGKEIKVSLHLK
jgi:hypothetical protein